MRRVPLLQWGVVLLLACQPQSLEADPEFNIEAMLRMYPRSGIQLDGGLGEQSIDIAPWTGDVPWYHSFRAGWSDEGGQEWGLLQGYEFDPPISSMAATGQIVSPTGDVHTQMWIEGMVHPESPGIVMETATTSIMYEWVALDSEDVAVDYIVDWNIAAETDGIGQRIYGEVGARVSGGIGPSGSPATVWEIAGPEFWDVENGQGFGSAQSKLMATSFDAVEGDSGWLNVELYFENSVEVAAPPPEPSIYGLFVGVKDTDAVRGDLDAINLYNVVSDNLPGFKEGIVLTADVAEGGLSDSQVEGAIDSLKGKMESGDKFIFYASSHGSSLAEGLETTVSPGDEFLALGSDLSDDSLMSYLTGMDDIEKWVMLDSCHSGGFWGNDNPSDTGDLEKLNNISLFAASAEDASAYADRGTGLGYFELALVDALSVDTGGFLFADADENYDVTFDELTYWVQNFATQTDMDGTVVFQKDLGDPVLFTLDMWSPVCMASPDFAGSLFGGELPPIGPQTIVPAPGAVLLGAIGLSVAGWRLRRRTT